MAEIATIARPWAEALFQAAAAAEDDGAQLAATAAWVAELGVIMADAQLQAFSANPGNTDSQVAALIRGLMQTPLGAQGENFLQYLIAQKRVLAMPAIAQQFHVLNNNRQGVVDAQVHSAFALDEAQKVELQHVLKQKFHRDLVLHITVVPELIGGVRVQVGDEVVDTSVRARLQQMKAALLA